MKNLQFIITFNYNNEEYIILYTQLESGFGVDSIRYNTNGKAVLFEYENISSAKMLEILHSTTKDDLVQDMDGLDLFDLFDFAD